MKIAVAPYLPIIAEATADDGRLKSLNLLDLSRYNYVSFLVTENWEEILLRNEDITSDYELFSMLISLPVVLVSPNRKAAHIRLVPDILQGCGQKERDDASQQLLALWTMRESRRIFAGTQYSTDRFNVEVDKSKVEVRHFTPDGTSELKELIDSFEPELDQLKHYHEARMAGGREVAAFSAYDKNDDRYARLLLRQAYEDHEGDIDDRTYLYTYDPKYKTFVEFRPDRGKKYHGRDIDIEYARREAPDVVERFNQ